MHRPDLVIGCGYLGRRVADIWRREGRSVLVLTRSLLKGEELRQAGFAPRVGDVCDPDCFPLDFPSVDRVLFAVGFDRASGKTQEEVFVGGLRNVLQRLGAKCRRFIYISSTSVFGQDDGSWVDESSACRPLRPGGICCLAAETLLREFFPAPPQDAVVVRLAGIYGPGRLLSRIDDLKGGASLPGRPDAWLNLIHVDDAAQAVVAVAAAERPGPVYLVSDDRPVQRAEYYGRLAALVGAPPPRFDPALSRARGSGDLNKRCSNRRMREDLRVALRFPTIAQGLPAALSATSESARKSR
jgi:nucleoside-diphosphate-sugar epimerase